MSEKGDPDMKDEFDALPEFVQRVTRRAPKVDEVAEEGKESIKGMLGEKDVESFNPRVRPSSCS